MFYMNFLTQAKAIILLFSCWFLNRIYKNVWKIKTFSIEQKFIKEFFFSIVHYESIWDLFSGRNKNVRNHFTFKKM